MKKILLLFLILLMGCFAPAGKNLKPVVLVTIPPYAYFVKAIAGDAVAVEIFVPPGANPHIYEPSPKQVEKFAGAKVWFRDGDPIEQKILPFLHEKNVTDIDLSKGFRLLCSADHHCDSAEEKDHHLWVDPLLAMRQAKTISEALSRLFPEHRTLFEDGYRQLAHRLKELHDESSAQLAPFKGITLLVAHPSLAYYCQRYGLHQLGIEIEGKEPLPQQVASLVHEARNRQVKAVFIEPQFSDKGAVLIAQELHVPICKINPLAEDYFAAMHQITDSIVKSYGHQS